MFVNAVRSEKQLKIFVLLYRMNYLSYPSNPVIRLLEKINRVSELLMNIIAKLNAISWTLIKLQKKATGSTVAAIVAALFAVGSAYVAVAAAIAKPEPITKTVLVIAAISAIATAIAAIEHVTDVIEANNETREEQSNKRARGIK